MAICGAGIVMMPDWAAADEIRTGKLVAILTDTPVSSDNTDICVAILTPQSAYRPVNVQAVIFFCGKMGRREKLGVSGYLKTYFCKIPKQKHRLNFSKRCFYYPCTLLPMA